MKTVRYFYFPLILLFGLISTSTYGQDAADQVYMLNGDIKKGKVVAINQDQIEFRYAGEELQYELQTGDIEKIVFASGRTESFNSGPVKNVPDTANNIASADRKNRLAILPFTMVSNDQGLMSEAMSGQLQAAAITSFKENTSGLDIQDAMMTNAILLKNGLDHVSIKTMMPKEVALLLGVEFVAYGTANIDFEGNTTLGSTSTTYEDKTKGNKTKGSEYSSSNSYSLPNYNTTIALGVFSDTGSNAYSVNRKGFGTSLDKYNGTLNYIIKRSPWGDKRK